MNKLMLIKRSTYITNPTFQGNFINYLKARSITTFSAINFSTSSSSRNNASKKILDKDNLTSDPKTENSTFKPYTRRKPNEGKIWNKSGYKNLYLKRKLDFETKGKIDLDKQDLEDLRFFINGNRLISKEYMDLQDKWQLKLYRRRLLKANNKKNFEAFVSNKLISYMLSYRKNQKNK
jgi:hypothetical protein